MDDQDKVSVIIPTFNREKYIVEALESAMAQTHRNLEIIVIDDGSTDNTSRILQPYVENKKITYLVQQHEGVSAARNKGIGVSNGRYIAFLDSDDVLERRHLEQLLHAMKIHPTSKIAFSAVEFFGDGGGVAASNDAFALSVKKCLACAFDRYGEDVSVSNSRLLQTFFESGVPFRCPASLVDRSLLQEHDLRFDPDISYTEDAHFMTLAAFHCPFIYVNRIGYRIRRHSENDNAEKYADKWITSFELRAERCKRYFRDKKMSRGEKKAFRRMLWSIHYEVALARSAANNIGRRVTESARLIYKAPYLRSIKSAARVLLCGGRGR